MGPRCARMVTASCPASVGRFVGAYDAWYARRVCNALDLYATRGGYVVIAVGVCGAYGVCV